MPRYNVATPARVSSAAILSQKFIVKDSLISGTSGVSTLFEAEKSGSALWLYPIESVTTLT